MALEACQSGFHTRHWTYTFYVYVPWSVVREPNQKKTHYFIGCGCPVTPLVCSHCRRRSTNCMWCQKRGYSTSFNFASHAYDINSAAIDLVSVQRRFSNVSIPYIMQIRLNWLNYHKFLKIKFYEYENIFFFLQTINTIHTIKTLLYLFFRVLCKPRCFI